MKKLLIAVFALICFTASAQDTGSIEFGANIGYNSSFVSSPAYLPSDSGSGVNFGMSIDYYLSDRWSIKAKLIYDQKGWDNGAYDIGNTRYLADYNLNYLTIPVTASWHFASKRNWYLHFGLYSGILLNADETSHDADVKDRFEKNDFGLTVGIGVKIPVSDKLKVFLEYDSQSGFSNISGPDMNYSLQNYRGSFNVGVNFLLK